MARTIGMTALALLMGGLAAQAQSPSFEVGLSAGPVLSTGKNDIYILGLLRPGLFFTPELELEGEVGAFGSIYFDGAMTVYGAGNLIVNFPISPGMSPFLLAGVGATNDFQESQHQGTIVVFNLGGGVKFPLRDIIGVRIEYRFQQWSGGNEHDIVQGPAARPYSITHVPAVDRQFHALVIGTSIFF